jgi:hypothetical protein
VSGPAHYVGMRVYVLKYVVLRLCEDALTRTVGVNESSTKVGKC